MNPLPRTDRACAAFEAAFLEVMPVRRLTLPLILVALAVLTGCQNNPAERLGYDLTAQARSFQPPPPSAAGTVGRPRG